MERYLIDTCIFVDHFREYQPATDWLTGIAPEPRGRLSYAAMTLVELRAGLRAHQERAMDRVLQRMLFLGVDEAISVVAGDYLRKLRPSHGLQVPDAVVAATAQVNGLVLVTRNRRHFPMDDIKTLVPYT